MRRYYAFTAVALVMIFASTYMLFTSLDKRVSEGERRITVVEEIQGDQVEQLRTLENRTTVVERQEAEVTAVSRPFHPDGSDRPPGRRKRPRNTPAPTPVLGPPPAPKAPEPPAVDDPTRDRCDERKYRRRHRRECRKQDDNLIDTVSNVLEGTIT